MAWEQIKPEIYEKWKKYWFNTHPDNIAEYSWNYLFTGGKQIRPRLFCELWQYLSPDSKINGELAFAIECIHVASLILDDIPWMDNALERRGKQTLHVVFSQRKACMLFHDVMYMVYLIWTTNTPEHIDKYEWEKYILEKLMYLTLGQWYDLEKKGTLIELASLKTGILFELVTETVAIGTNLDRDFWKSWGNYLGILFQWMDDWHDREEDTLQLNRNAFNEDYDNTLKLYIDIWKKIQMGVGTGWFSSSFGVFMKTYFTDEIKGIEAQPMPAFIDLILPYPVNIVLPTIVVPVFAVQYNIHIGTQYVKKALSMLQIIVKNSDKYVNKMNVYADKYKKRYEKINRMIWKTDENTWENNPGVIRLITDIYQEMRKDMREISRPI